jgi:hypothetical protein
MALPCQVLFFDSRPGAMALDLIMLEKGNMGAKRVGRGAPMGVAFRFDVRSTDVRQLSSVVHLLGAWARACAVIRLTCRQGPGGAGLMLCLGDTKVALITDSGSLAPGLAQLFRTGAVWGQAHRDALTMVGELAW